MSECHDLVRILGYEKVRKFKLRKKSENLGGHEKVLMEKVRKSQNWKKSENGITTQQITKSIVGGIILYQIMFKTCKKLEYLKSQVIKGRATNISHKS